MPETVEFPELPELLNKPNECDRLARAFAELALKAGAAIMEIYAQPFEVRTKADRSPVSDADEVAEEILIAGVRALLPGVPIVAEESAARGDIPAVGRCFILIDPLDGTREFISKNGEFTVNIALVQDGRPIIGCVYAPAIARMFIGGGEAWCADIAPDGDFAAAEFRRISTRPYPQDGLMAMVSRSHQDPDTLAFLDKIGVVDKRDAGSSLKFCLLAAGDADVYPRFGPTMEWDTAAGHAVLAAAGGQINKPDGNPFPYGKTDRDFKNGPFIAWGKGPVP